jgi:hypothetical protein
MRMEEVRPGVFKLEITAHELSVLLAGARMSLSLIDADPDEATGEARGALRSVLANFDAALKMKQSRETGEQAP